MTEIIIDPHGPGRIVCRPAGYLGGDLFTAYRSATSSAGARYDRAAGGQTAAVEDLPGLIAALAAAGFAPRVSPGLADMVEAAAREAEDREKAARARIQGSPAGRPAGLSLFPFQVAGATWLAGRTSAILADDQGIGKTCQTLAALPDRAPVVVVCPAVAKGVWRTEAGRWRPEFRTEVLSGRKSFRWPVPGEIVVLNYDILPAAVPPDAPAGLVVVADECHQCKNPKAARTERFRALARIALANSGRVYQLSGTPLLNRPMELYTILGNGGPDLLRQSFGSWNGFVSAFRGRREQVARGVYAWEFDGPAEGDPTAAQALARVMLRRRKEDVLPDLPERIVQRIEVNNVDKSVYSLCDSVLAGIESRGMDLEEIITRATGGGMPGFEDISRMRAACAAAKIPHAIALVEEYEEAGEPVVVASAHRAPIDAIGSRPGWASITGDTSAEERTRIQEEFQAGRLRGVAMTIQAGGVAITLTHASRMILVDLAWTPGINAQAEDRIHRIGQRNSCLYQHLVLQHPLEARIWSLLQEKRDLVDRTVEAAADLHRAGSDGGRSTAQALRQAAQAAQSAPAPAPAPKARRGWSTQEELDGVGVLRGVVLRKIPATEEFAKFVRSLVVQLDSRGGLTEKQWAAVRDIGDRHYGRGRGDVVLPVTTSGWHRWVAEGVLLLSEMDPDRARTRNGAGWNQADGFVGAEYARRIQTAGGLAACEWEDAARRLARYVRTQYRPFAPGDRETGT